jgi:hypothetical protein
MRHVVIWADCSAVAHPHDNIMGMASKMTG